MVFQRVRGNSPWYYTPSIRHVNPDGKITWDGFPVTCDVVAESACHLSDGTPVDNAHDGYG